MQITIDTEKDSKENIRKAVAFLNSLSEGNAEQHSNIFEDSSPSLGSSEASEPASANAFANMFGSSESKNVMDETPILGVETEKSKEEKEEKEEIPSTIIEY